MVFELPTSRTVLGRSRNFFSLSTPHIASSSHESSVLPSPPLEHPPIRSHRLKPKTLDNAAVRFRVCGGENGCDQRLFLVSDFQQSGSGSRVFLIPRIPKPSGLDTFPTSGLDFGAFVPGPAVLTTVSVTLFVVCTYLGFRGGTHRLEELYVRYHVGWAFYSSTDNDVISLVLSSPQPGPRIPTSRVTSHFTGSPTAHWARDHSPERFLYAFREKRRGDLLYRQVRPGDRINLAIYKP